LLVPGACLLSVGPRGQDFFGLGILLVAIAGLLFWIALAGVFNPPPPPPPSPEDC
jgi:hypothetical protein